MVYRRHYKNWAEQQAAEEPVAPSELIDDAEEVYVHRKKLKQRTKSNASGIAEESE